MSSCYLCLAKDEERKRTQTQPIPVSAILGRKPKREMGVARRKRTTCLGIWSNMKQVAFTTSEQDGVGVAERLGKPRPPEPSTELLLPPLRPRNAVNAVLQQRGFPSLEEPSRCRF
ncbi:hypothetical protein NDU88_005250 [Pleurodeles waltl]|uniref:Uncharacterized protein n=1 Tax=Pleurodeles waltl TaxID=8319 RepID=A0AAV7RKH9_PLEWA|nr:hypothetical protein NDU88_005250 [Pleurodeles waltl]